MAYTTIDKPSDYFNTVLYTGNGSTQSITGVGFQPDFTWLKSRNNAYDHFLYDAVRGQGKYLQSNKDYVEADTDQMTSFDSDGYTVGVTGGVATNGSGSTMASWNWKAGTSFTNDASATGIGTIDSTGSFNNDSGFSIVSYTGTGSNGTIKHGLNSAPSCIITKSRSAVEDWGMYHVSIGNTSNISLNKTNAEYSANSAFWNNTNPTSSVFTVGTHPTINYNTKTMIAYCFAEKQGYSKFGSYTGNGNADGTFIYTGFKPALFLLKANAAGENWRIFDNKRSTFNPNSISLQPNSSNAEASNTDIDFCSNGIKLLTTSGEINPSGTSFIYMAFAESPLVAGNFVPTTAR